MSDIEASKAVDDALDTSALKDSIETTGEENKNSYSGNVEDVLGSKISNEGSTDQRQQLSNWSSSLRQVNLFTLPWHKLSVH